MIVLSRVVVMFDVICMLGLLSTPAGVFKLLMHNVSTSDSLVNGEDYHITRTVPLVT